LQVEELEALVLLSNPLSLIPASPPPATAGTECDQTMTVTGGTGPYTSLSVTAFNAGTTGLASPSANLAAGTVTVNSIPSGAGTATFTVNVTDSGGATLSQSDSITVNPALEMTPANLPQGTAGIAYVQTITVQGGTAPYTALTVTGFDPGSTGLSAPLANVNTGTVSINSTATAAGIATFTVRAGDSAGAVLTETYTLTVPAALAITPPALPEATVGTLYNQTVSIAGGSGPYRSLTVTGFNAGTTGLAAPTTNVAAGTVTINSTPTGAGSASFSVNVIDNAGVNFSQTYAITVPVPSDVLTYHNNNSSTGENLAETVLTPANVNPTTFGKLFATQLDGPVEAQPLYMDALSITTGPNPGVHNVVFVATENDSLYALDAGNGTLLWHASLRHAVHGGTVTPVPPADVHAAFDGNPEIGITSTPVIDPATNTIYAVAFTKEVASDGAHFIYQLYALDVASGTEKLGGLAVIADSLGNTYVSGPTVQGSGAGSSGGTVYFDALPQDQRPSLTLANGSIYVGFASFNDTGPYHGWVLGYSAANLQPTAVFNATPNGAQGGIWQSNGRIAVDDQGNLYFETGNGTFETTRNAPGGFPILGDYGDSFVKLAVDPASGPANQNMNGWGLKVVDYFTPYDESHLDHNDIDLGSGAPLLLPSAAGSAAHPDLLVGSGKSGRIYVIDRNDMGHFDPTTDHVVQETPNDTISMPSGAVGSDFSTAAYYDNTIYYVGQGGFGLTFPISAGVLAAAPSSQSSDVYLSRGSTPSISADGNTNGIVWDLDSTTSQLRAYDAGGYDQELYTSMQAAGNRDSLLGTVMHFAVPTVTAGHVFVGTSLGLVVYGLLSPASLPQGTAGAAYQQTLTPHGGTLPYTKLAVIGFDAGATGLALPQIDLANGTIIINSTPSAAGAAAFTVNATDSAGTIFTQTYTITVNPALSATPLALPQGTAGTTYNQAITVAGGTEPYTAVSVTAFDAGVTGLSVPTASSNGTVSIASTPTSAGTVTFTVNVTDSAGAMLTQPYFITINPALGLTPARPPGATVGTPYQQTLMLTGGTTPYTSLSVIGFNNRGTGLTAPMTNLISGTIEVGGMPQHSGTAVFTIQAQDSAGAVFTQTCTVMVNPAPRLSSTELPPARTGLAYTQKIRVTGGTRPLASLTVTDFQSGGTGLTAPHVSLAGGTIVVTGTAHSTGSVTFTVEVTDGAGATFIRKYRIVVLRGRWSSAVSSPFAKERE